MVGKYKVITLCGSTKFKEEFYKAASELSKKEIIVLSVNSFNHADNTQLTEEQITTFNDMHRKKIDISDEIFVINKDGYIGENTRSEIEYAIKQGKKVNYMYVNCSLNCLYNKGECKNIDNAFCIRCNGNKSLYSCPYYERSMNY